MRNGPMKLWALAAMVIAAPALAQTMPDIGFKSVGRGRPLTTDVNQLKEVGPSWIRTPGQPRTGVEMPLNGFTSGAARHRAAAARHLHERRLLQRQGALERPALLPLQQPDGHGVSTRHLAAARRERREQDRGGPLGSLRKRRSARGHRESVRFQDGAGALRGAARGDAQARRTRRVHDEELSGRRVERRSTRARGSSHATYGPGIGASTARSRPFCRR